jgi:hypothetical protein
MHIFPLHRLSFLCVLNVVGCLGNASLWQKNAVRLMAWNGELVSRQSSF